MRKIWTKSVFEFNAKTQKYELNENESQSHYIPDDMPIAHMKGGGGSTTTVQNTAPWTGQQPYLMEGFQNAENAFLRDQPPAYYIGPEISPNSATTEQAQSLQRARALAGSPLNGSTTGMLNNTLNGNYLFGGKGFDEALAAASRKINPMVDSPFERGGRAGSGLAATARQQATSDSFANLYNNERERQMGAAQLAPGAANMDYNDISKLADVGGAEDRLNQERINADKNRWDYYANSRRNSVADFIKLIQGNYGQSSSSTTPDGGLTGWKRYLAGAGSGALMGSSMGPAGAAAGGALGLLQAWQ